MLNPWSVVTARKSADNEQELKRVYGPQATVSRVGAYNLIHLDRPAPAEIERRVREFDPEELLRDGCPICRMLRGQGLDVIFMRKLELDHERLEPAGAAPG